MNKSRWIISGLCMAVLILWIGAVHGQSSGYIISWGSQVIPEPGTLEDFISIASGSAHNLGLKSDGTVEAWGENYHGQCVVPEPNGDFIAIAAGNNLSLGLKSDGMVVGWGGAGDPPVPNSDFIAITVGAAHCLGLKIDGTIVAWGNNEHRQCNVPALNANFVAVAAGDNFSLGLKRSTTTCAIPDIVSYGPLVVSSDNCASGCAVNFSVTTQDDYSQLQKITLERKLPGLWAEEDEILSPIGDPDWKLTCDIDGHYTDGPHTFRAVFHCQDGSKDYSFPVFVDAE